MASIADSAVHAVLRKMSKDSIERESLSVAVVSQLTRQVEALAEMLERRETQHRAVSQGIPRSVGRRLVRRLAGVRRRLRRVWREVLESGPVFRRGVFPTAAPVSSIPIAMLDPAWVAEQLCASGPDREQRADGASGAVGGIIVNLRLLMGALQAGQGELVDALARVFVVAFPGTITADWVTSFLSAMRERSSRPLPRALAPFARRKWPQHVGIAFEVAALEDHFGDPSQAIAAWEAVLGLTNEHVAPNIFTTARRRLRDLAKGNNGHNDLLTGLFSPMIQDEYHDWLRQREDHSIDAYRRWLDQNLNEDMDTSQGPTFSIVMPVYQPDVTHLSAAIRSVLGQWCPNWQLVLSDDASSNQWMFDAEIALLLADPRITTVRATTNGGISAATNRALEATSGRWVAFMDQDDLLAPDALAHVVDVISKRPAARLVFSDEDHLDQQGNRCLPYFKPEIVRELLLGQNVINHFAVYARETIITMDDKPVLRAEFDGSQDWDLNLRVVEGLRDDEIVHIPRVLYHWRQTGQSFSHTRAHVSYLAGARAVAESLKRQALVGVTRPVAGGGWFQIHLRTGEVKPRASIVIPTRDHPELISQCLASIIDFTDYPSFEIIIVDNGTRDPRALAMLHDADMNDRVTIVRVDEPFNFSRLLNSGVRAATGDVVVSLNNDVTVHQADWLNQLIANAMRPGVGAVGVRLLYPNRTVQHAGVVLGLGGVAGHSFGGLNAVDAGYFGQAILARDVEAVTGAVLAVRRDTYLAMGGFDEKNLSVAFNDVDFCLRLRERGLRNLVLASVELTHLESESRGSDAVAEREAAFRSECQFMINQWGDNQGVIIDRIKNSNFSQHFGDALLEDSSDY